MPVSKNSPNTPMALWLGLAFIVILADQLTKTLILHEFQLHDSRSVTSFFNLVRAHNTGAAFSFLAGASGWQRWFFIGLGAVAAIFIVWMLRSHGGQRMFAWALSLILGGAFGNLIDRAVAGHVVDFVDVYWGRSHFWAFNVADAAISIGAVLVLLDMIGLGRQHASHTV